MLDDRLRALPAQGALHALALNLVRLGAWLGGTPLARTRQSAYARLMTEAA